MKSIPTKYAGVQMRSRLEARWAAFFDLCDWNWDYEPDFGTPGWIPDFVLRWSGEPMVLVEIKPIHKYDPVPMGKSVAACQEAGIFPELWLLGSSVHTDWYDSLGGDPETDGLARYGWYRPPHGRWVTSLGSTDMPVDKTIARWREAGNRVQWRKP